MEFLNPVFLFGLAAAALPPLIHLLLRDRVRRVAFSTLQFFGGASRKTLRKKRFQELLLILLRMLACALLAMAFARPILTALFGDQHPNQKLAVGKARVVVVDVSASMDRGVTADELRERVRPWLEKKAVGQGTALVAFDSVATVLAPFTPAGSPAPDALEKLAPGYGAGDLLLGLRKAAELLQGVKAEAKEIVLVSDLQHGGWEGNAGDWRLEPGTALLVDAVPWREKPANLSLTEVSYPPSLVRDGSSQNLGVRVHNAGKSPAAGVRVTLLVNGKKVDTKKLNVPAEGQAAARFRHVFDKSGDNRVEFALEAADLTDRDNHVFANTRVIPKIRVLLASPAPGRTKTSAFFVRAALAPTKESPFDVTSVASGRVTAQQVRQADVVLLAEALLPTLAAQELQSLLERGGGLLVLPGESQKPEAFAASLGEAAPCGLRKIIHRTRPDGTSLDTGLAEIDYTHPIFEVFLAPHHGDFATFQFKRYWEAADSQLSRVLAKFDDGRPAMLERRVGRGVSVLWLSPPEASWNNLPFRALYAPLLHQTLRYLALRTEPRTNYMVGDLLPVAEGATLTDPAGAEVKGAPVATVPGFYRLTEPNREPVTLAVNTPLEESKDDLLTDKELIAAVKPLPKKQPAAGTAEAAVDPASQGDRGVWAYLLCGLLALLLMEVFVGNRTVRH